MKIEIGDTVTFKLVNSGTEWGKKEIIVMGKVAGIQPDKSWGLCYFIEWTNKNGFENIARRPANELLKMLTDSDIDVMVWL